jgi:hypothetical protein
MLSISEIYNKYVKGASVKVVIPDDKIDMHLYIKVRPYKKSNCKKTYGKWSDKTVLYIN